MGKNTATEGANIIIGQNPKQNQLDKKENINMANVAAELFPSESCDVDQKKDRRQQKASCH